MRTPEQIEEVLDRMEALLKSYEDADNAYKDKQESDAWNSKYGERLGKYADKLKTLNGDDFDIMSESRKEYKDQYSDLSDDDYVNALEDNIKKVLNRVWPEASDAEVEEAAKEIADGQDEADVTVIEKTSDESMKEPVNNGPVNKRHPGRDGKPFWGNPSTSGGRGGKTSDEECKEEIKSPEDSFKDELEAYMKKNPKRNNY